MIPSTSSSQHCPASTSASSSKLHSADTILTGCEVSIDAKRGLEIVGLANLIKNLGTMFQEQKNLFKISTSEDIEDSDETIEDESNLSEGTVRTEGEETAEDISDDEESLARMSLINLEKVFKKQKDTFKNIAKFVNLLSFSNTEGAITSNCNKAIAGCLERKEIISSCGLDFEEQIIPPYSGHYSAMSKEERREAIKRMSILSLQKESIGSGCSILLDVFYDYLESCYRDCKTDSGMKPCLSQPMKVQFDGPTGKFTYCKRHVLLDVLMVNIRMTIGLLAQMAIRGGSWHAPLGFSTEENATTFQKSISEIIHATDIHTQTLSIGDFASGQKFLDGFKLLQDIAMQEMHLLFRPLEAEPKLDQQFQRIQYRLRLFQTQVLELETSLPPGYQIHKKREKNDFSASLRRDSEWLKEFCIKLTKSISPLTSSKAYKPADLRNCYTDLKEFYFQSVKSLKGTQTHSQLSVVVQEQKAELSKGNLSTEQKELVFFSHLIQQVKKTMNSILMEGLSTILPLLIREGHVSDQELKNCLENLIDGCRAIKEALTQELIKKKIEECADQKLTLVEASVFKSLREMWQAHFQTTRLHVMDPLIDLLEKRLKRACVPNGYSMELVLAIRDALMIVQGGLHREAKDAKNVLEGLTTFTDEIKNSQLLEIFDEMQEVNKLTYEACVAAVGGIQALIGRCLDEADSRSEKDKVVKQKVKSSQEIAVDHCAQSLIEEEAAEKLKKLQKKKGKASAIASNNKHVSNNNNRSNGSAKKQISPVKVDQKVITQPQVIKAVKDPQIPTLKNKLLTPKQSIALIRESMESIKDLGVEGAQKEFRRYWRDAQLSNLSVLLSHFSETMSDKQFSSDLVFGQTDLCRRMMEAAMEIVLGHYPVIDNEASVLADIGYSGHQLHVLVGLLLKGHKDNIQSVPQNIYNIVWELRGIPYALSQANNCVNYLYSAVAEEWQSPQAKKLLSFFLEIEKYSKQTPSIEKKTELMDKHCEVVNKSLYFVQELLRAAVAPDWTIKPLVPEMKKLEMTLSEELPHDLKGVVQKQQSMTKLKQQATSSNEAVAVIRISDRKEALLAIDKALSWISIRCMSSVTGLIGKSSRADKRNQALHNVAMYLRRLATKLSAQRGMRPYDTVCGELSLIRRAHKELIIAALYHGQYFNDGQHVVESDELRRINNPCTLMDLLRNYSSGDHKFPTLSPWMANIHIVVSYPTPLQKDTCISPQVEESRQLIARARECSEMKARLIPGFTLVGQDGKETSEEKQVSEAYELIESMETEKTFPGLAALLKTLQSTYWASNGDVFGE